MILIIPKGTLDIEESTYQNREDITEVILPDGLTTIKANAFSGCKNLKILYIPDSVTTIEAYAFAECENLEVIYLSINTETIGAYAFLNCKRLASILLPSSIKSIGEGAFKNCSNLKSLILPEFITAIENECFEGCVALISLIIPGYVESIGYRSFANCIGLKYVQLSKALKSIWIEAFADCVQLFNTYIPKSVEIIGTDAFLNVHHIVYDGNAEGSPWGALTLTQEPKRDYVKGNDVYNNLKQIQDKTTDVFTSIREILRGKLEGQGKSLSETMSSSSIINDIKKLETSEDVIGVKDFSNLHFIESDLYQNNILPSNVLMLSFTRIVYIEDGLIYFIDFDDDTLQVTNKVIYKLDEMMHLENSGIPAIYRGSDCIFVVPKYTDTIICIYGDGVYGTGDVRYNRIMLPNEVEVMTFGVETNNITKSHTLTFIAADYRYYRFDNFMASVIYDETPWKINVCPHYFTHFCIGANDFVCTDHGEIFKYNIDTESFDYIIDIYNERDWQVHYENYLRDKISYHRILSFTYNCGRWIVICEGVEYLLTSANFEETMISGADFLETVTDDFMEIPLPTSFSIADIAVNDISSEDTNIIYGFDSEYNAIAITFSNDINPIEIIEFGKDTKPQYCTFAIYRNRAVMLNLYDSIEHGFYHMYTDMKVATYADYIYTFGPSYNPCFMPYHIAYGNNRSVVFGKTASGKNFNVAVSVDTHHWNIFNLNPDDTINIQCLEFIDENFYAAGANSDRIIYSGNGIEWNPIILDKTRNIVCMCSDHSIVNRGQITASKLYILDYNTAEVISIDLRKKEITNIINFSQYLPGNEYYGIHLFVNDLQIFNTNQLIVNCIVNAVLCEVLIDLNTLEITVNEKNSRQSGYILSDPSTILKRSEIDEDEKTYSFIDVDLLEGANVSGYNITNISKYLSNGEKPCIDKFLGNIIFNINSEEDYGNIATNNFILRNNTEIDSLGFPLVTILANTMCVCGNRLIITHKYRNKFSKLQYMMESVKTNSFVSMADIDIRKDIYNVRNDQISIDNRSQSIKYISTDIYPMSINKMTLTNMSSGPLYYFNGTYVSLPSSTDSSTNNSFYYSTDEGISWSMGKLPIGGNWTDITCVDGTWYIIRKVNNDTSEIYASEDLLTWTLKELNNSIDTIKPSFAYCETIYKNDHYLTIFVSDAASVYYAYMIDNGVITIDKVSSPSLGCNRITINEEIETIVIYSNIDSDNDLILISPNTNGYPMLSHTSLSYLYDITDSFRSLAYFDNYLFYSRYNPSITTDIYYDIVACDLNTHTCRVVNTVKGGNMLKTYHIDNGLACGIIGAYGTTDTLYVSTDKPEFLFFNISPVNIQENIIFTNGHTTLVNDEKIMVTSNHIYNIDIGNDISEFYEGSFYVESGKDIVVNTPFIPDHVFISLAQSDNINSKYVYSEIHRTDVIELDGSVYNSITIFDGSEGHLIYRADSGTTILNRGFSFSNNTLNDRHLNFIAIKENRYE